MLSQQHFYILDSQRGIVELFLLFFLFLPFSLVIFHVSFAIIPHIHLLKAHCVPQFKKHWSGINIKKLIFNESTLLGESTHAPMARLLLRCHSVLPFGYAILTEHVAQLQRHGLCWWMLRCYSIICKCAYFFLKTL